MNPVAKPRATRAGTQVDVRSCAASTPKRARTFVSQAIPLFLEFHVNPAASESDVNAPGGGGEKHFDAMLICHGHGIPPVGDPLFVGMMTGFAWAAGKQAKPDATLRLKEGSFAAGIRAYPSILFAEN